MVGNIRRLLLFGSGGFQPSSTTPGIWLDASEITGLADGEACTTWLDTSGNARNATATGTAKPLYKTAILGAKPVLRFDGTDDLMNVTIPATAEFTLMVVAKQVSNKSNNERVAAVGAFGSIQYADTSGVYNDQVIYGFYGNEAFAQVNTVWDAKPWGAMLYTYTSTALSFYGDNNLLTAAFNPADFPATAEGILIGALATDNWANCDIALVGWWPRVISESERAKLGAWLRGYMGQTYLVYVGDSLLDESVTSTIQAKVAVLKGNTYTRTSFAVSGQTADTLNTNKAAMVARYSQYRSANKLIFWAGTNDIADGTAAADVIADIAACCTAFKAAGYFVVVVNVLARGDLDAAKLIVRTAVNASIAANWATYANAFVDVTADARLQNPADTTYFNADTVHLVDAGDAIVAALIAAAV